MDKETLDELWTNLGAQLEGTSNLIQETNVVLNQISEATLHNTNQISELTSQLTIAKDRFVNRRQKDDETFSSFITDITKYAKLLQPESTDSILTKTPGRARNFEYTIFIKDNEPIHKTPYYLPPDKEILLKNHINELVNLDILKPAQSPWASPNIQEHHKHLQIVLARFKKLNLTINPNKAKFFMQRLKILGHVISSEGRIPNPEKVEAIRTMPIPKNLKELQSFLGMAAFFARYIQNFSTIVAPLNALKKKDAKFIITQTHVDAINKLKTVLTTAPILRFPIFDDKHPFIVTTDASSIGVGACLMQKFENKLHPIEYCSRKLNPAESKYPVYQLELLAVLHALNTFKDYLLDRKFILRTDCNALVYLFNTPQRFNKLSRWLLTISKFNFTTEHIRGTENVVADCLSSNVQNFAIRDGLLVRFVGRNRNKRIVLTDSLLDYVLDYFHSSVFGCHSGVTKTYREIAKRFSYPDLYKKTVDYVKKCSVCATCKPINYKISAPDASISEKNVYNKLYVDFIGPLIPSADNGFKYIFVITDAYSKFCWAYPTRKATSAVVIKILHQLFMVFGFPKVLISDNAKSFKSNKYTQFLLLNGIRIGYTSPYRPQGNITERINRNIKINLTCVIKQYQMKHKDWNKILPFIIFNYNSTYHSIIKASPAAVFLGRTWNQPLDLLLNTTDILAMEKPPSVDMVQQALHKATVMRKARQHQAPTDVKFHVNQLVRVRLPPTASNIDEDRKFSPRFSDVKRIIRFTTPVSVELIDPKTNELSRTHVTHLKRAEVL
ncbi:uncharacterized protein LOC123296136 [Chrysoperla carnea]|uniref:uncharacterized protein LOC123296136 n=1 Tax=Chrysoperla carnea TaxID=189513 RepID=UPI001D08DC9B|nr:uncharacterized protein LOC123296136 [Chrysoperla carnea]